MLKPPLRLLLPLERLQQHVRKCLLPRVLLVVGELAEVDFDLVTLDGFLAGGGGGFEFFEAFAEGIGGDLRPFPARPPSASRFRQCNAVHYRVEAASEPPSRKAQALCANMIETVSPCPRGRFSFSVPSEHSVASFPLVAALPPQETGAREAAKTARESGAVTPPSTFAPSRLRVTPS